VISRWLLLLVPLSLCLRYFASVPPLVVFAAAVLAIVPLAEWIRRSTEQLALSLGRAIGGLLNVTFGNVTELLLAFFVLLDGRVAVVKAQLTGSIIANSLLGLGLAIVIGGWGRERQKFNRASAGRLSSLLILTVIALLVPALFDVTERSLHPTVDVALRDERLSLGVSVVLIIVYAASLVYALVTHRELFQSDEPEERSGPEAGERWPVRSAVVVLLVCTVFTAWEAEIIAGALEGAAAALGLSLFFLGVIVLAVIGNAAEYVAAIYFARKNRMTLALSLTVGSSLQVALLLIPALVLISYGIGHRMNLVFGNPLELVAIAAAAFAVNAVTADGETSWFEGVLLLGTYLLLVMAFLFLDPPPAQSPTSSLPSTEDSCAGSSCRARHLPAQVRGESSTFSDRPASSRSVKSSRCSISYSLVSRASIQLRCSSSVCS
jgi:Ca2+:H+ antiporter